MRTQHPDMMQQLSAMLGLAGQAQQLDAQDAQGQFDEQMNPMRLQQIQQLLGHNEVMQPMVQQEGQFNLDHMQEQYELDQRAKEAQIAAHLMPGLMAMYDPNNAVDPNIAVKQYMMEHFPGRGMPDMSSLVEQAKQAEFRKYGIDKLFQKYQPQTH